MTRSMARGKLRKSLVEYAHFTGTELAIIDSKGAGERARSMIDLKGAARLIRRSGKRVIVTSYSDRARAKAECYETMEGACGYLFVWRALRMGQKGSIGGDPRKKGHM